MKYSIGLLCRFLIAALTLTPCSSVFAQVQVSTVFSPGGGECASESYLHLSVLGESIAGIQESVSFTQHDGFIYQIGQFEPPDTVFVFLDDTSASSGDTLLIPTSISNLGMEVFPPVEAYMFTLTYENDSLFTPTGEYETDGTLSDGWLVFVNTGTPGEVTVVAASDDYLELEGVLICLEFSVSEEIAEDVLCNIEITNMQFNEGNPVENISEATAIVTLTPSETVSREDIIPEEYSLFQNYPNPFNPSTSIEYSVPVSSEIILSVYNINGQIVDVILNSFRQPGYYTVEWIPDDLPSGIYFVEMRAGNFQDVMKTSYIK